MSHCLCLLSLIHRQTLQGQKSGAGGGSVLLTKPYAVQEHPEGYILCVYVALWLPAYDKTMCV